MKFYFSVIGLVVLCGCAPSDEEVALRNNGLNVASQIWTEPGVAGAIGLSGTFVADFKPEADALFRSIPQSLGAMRYGAFDEFTLVMFNSAEANHDQVLAGMGAYCRTIGRRLKQITRGVMEQTSPNTPPAGWVTGRCL